MAKYVLKFSKEDFFKYTSHLDLMRFFKRSFKRANIMLEYSQGFNPHPKMGFAQPLSLGYSGVCEYLEFETAEHFNTESLLESLKLIMPPGLKLTGCIEYKQEGKSLAALTVSAEYIIGIPVKNGEISDINKMISDFLNQHEIIVKKRQKKTKELVDIDIKGKIQNLSGILDERGIMLSATLDAGSESNLSPELLIDAFLKFTGISTLRYDIDVERRSIDFANGFKM